MLSLTINGVDYTAKWRMYESSWTLRAWQGESAQSKFVIDDDDGTIDHANLAAKKIVEVWEDASGSSKCMYRGRVANKTLGMSSLQAPGVAMRWNVDTEDYNVDLKGIEVQGFERGEETDDERVEAVRLEFLNGLASVSPRARQSTNLDGTYIGSDPLDAAPLYDETYTDTDPLGVLTRIVEMTGRVFFVYLDDDGDGELVYFNRASDADDLLSDIEIVDDSEGAVADNVTTFAAHRGPQAGDHGGQNIMTGGSARYQAGGYYRESNVDGRETTYDKWEITLRNDNIRREEAAADYLQANVDASEETFTYWATLDMRAEYAHLIRAGMRVRIKRVRANQTTSQRLLVVTSQHEPVTLDSAGHPMYRVTLEIGRPVNPHTTRSRFHIPIPATPTTPPGPPGAPTLDVDLEWTYPTNLLDDGTSTYTAGGVWVSGASHTFATSHMRVNTTYQRIDPRILVTPGQTVRFAGDVSANAFSLTTKTMRVEWYTNPGDLTPASFDTITAPASSYDQGVQTSFDGSHVVPAGIDQFSIRIDRQAFYDNLILQVINDDATPGTPGTPGAGTEDTVGDDDEFARADHDHVVFRLVAPDTDDDLEHGFPAGVIWKVVDDLTAPTTVLAIYESLDDTDGAAVWHLEYPEAAKGIEVGETGDEPFVNVATVFFDGATVTDDGDGQVTVGIPSGTSLAVEDGTTTVDPVTLLQFDPAFFEVTDEGADTASVTFTGSSSGGSGLPLTGVVAGEPVLIWDENNSLIGDD